MKSEIRDTNSRGLLALHIQSPADRTGQGVHFFSRPDDPLQVGLLKHPAGRMIEAHCHSVFRRVVDLTSEVLVVTRGVLRAVIYNNDHSVAAVVLIRAGDVLVLFSGGHGFEVVEDCEVFEVKTGPYAGDKDKVRFKMPQETPRVMEATTTLEVSSNGERTRQPATTPIAEVGG